MTRKDIRAVMSEFIGCTIAGFFGLGACVALNCFGFITDLFEVAIMWGLLFALLVMVFMKIGGAHFNPGVTLAMLIFKDFPRKLVLPYIAAQVFGWFFGVILIFILPGNILETFAITGGNPSTLFNCTAVEPHFWAAATYEFMMSALLLFFIFAAIDQKNSIAPSPKAFPFIVGVIIAFCIAFGGGVSGTAMNFARDLGPRFAELLVGSINGWDTSSLFGNWQWLMYIISPTVGALAGGAIYFLVVEKYFKEITEEEKKAA
ncbi:MAG: aquaporin, partial [Eggerthellaceae bacterium]|nr:aquaporin [Eggerthellaceae bacterium]